MNNLFDGYINQQQAQQQTNIFGNLQGIGLGQALGQYIMGSQGIPSAYQQQTLGHYQQVKHFRKEFKQLSKEEFRKMSNDPHIKEIMTGSIFLTAEEKIERIKEHLKQ